MLAVLYSRHDLAFGRAITGPFISDDDAWHVLQPLEQRAKELLRCLLVASPLDENVQDVVVLIHRTPQVIALTVNS